MSKFPAIPIDDLAEGERPHARVLQQALLEMLNRVEGFESALALFKHAGSLRDSIPLGDESGRRWLYSDWQYIAAKEATFEVYHFGSILIKNIGEPLRHCGAIRAVHDAKKLSAARTRFDKFFPNWEHMRDAVGHGSEHGATLAKLEAHAILSPIADEEGKVLEYERILDRKLRGDEFSLVYKQQQMSLSISAESVEKLRAVLANAWEAFSGVRSLRKAGC